MLTISDEEYTNWLSNPPDRVSNPSSEPQTGSPRDFTAVGDSTYSGQQYTAEPPVTGWEQAEDIRKRYGLGDGSTFAASAA
jgi:hypothetical protein